MIHFYKSSIIILLCNTFIFSASHKSLTNKYAFSDDYLDSLREIVLSNRAHFYSLPNSVNLPNYPFYSYTHNDHNICADLYLISSYEMYRKKHLRNFFFGSLLSYRSSFVRGEFQFDLHSTNRYSPRDYADSLNDIAYEQVVSHYDHIAGTGVNKDFNFHLGYLEFYYKDFSLLFGKYPLRWGPGYKGTLGLSGTGFSPFYYYLMQLDINKKLHASAFLSGLDDSYLFVRDTIINADRFSAGQRLDIRFNEHFQLGVYELVNFNGTALLSRFANPIQLYYFSNHLGGGIPERRNNIFGGLDFNIILNKFRLYGEFINDDITIFDGNRSPNKFGFQVGSMYFCNNLLNRIGIEYTHISQWTYGHWLPGLNRHTYFRESRGWPWGNDMDLWHFRARCQLPKNISITSEINWWIKGAGTLTEYHWDIPDSVRPNLDNIGGMVDYKNDKHLVSFLFGVIWKPVSLIDIEVMWLPLFSEGSLKNRIRGAAVVWLPNVFKRNINFVR